MRKIGELAYELNFPRHWKVHRVVSVAHLYPAPISGTYPALPTPVISTSLPSLSDASEDTTKEIISTSGVEGGNGISGV
ncbi:hypothetical protein CIB48_g6027 [Xylaria polymorpha]|nr:hypothetical protein CIB48_g6027 [Xylaria polymorpha]